jgi:hypothetical protein
MSLPSRWIDALFSKLTLTYGQEFLRKFEGLPMAEVKADWSETLSGFQQHPQAIRYGLDHLPPEKPPNALQFRDLCRKAPLPRVAAIEAPRTDPERLSDELRRIKSMEIGKRGDFRAWAYLLRDREQSQAKGATGRAALTKYQRDAWRYALGQDAHTPEVEEDKP